MTTMAYEFFRNNFCSTYIEIIKPTLYGKQGSKEDRLTKQKLLAVLLVNILGVLHPIAPLLLKHSF